MTNLTGSMVVGFTTSISALYQFKEYLRTPEQQMVITVLQHGKAKSSIVAAKEVRSLITEFAKNHQWAQVCVYSALDAATDKGAVFCVNDNNGVWTIE